MPQSSASNILNHPHLQMIHVEGGTFWMGDDESDDNYEKPAHKVSLSSFYLGQYPVTNEQFIPFLNELGNQVEGGRTWVNFEGSYLGARCGIMENAGTFECIPGLEQHPMIYVSWYGAQSYCKWLSDKTGKNYRLPSEAEWEYAARGGKHKSPFIYSGSNHLNEVGWYDVNSHRETKRVGMKLPNQLGLYDMSGNVYEWCADHWHENYDGAPDDGSAWTTGGEDRGRVVRGGSWFNDGNDCRVSDRFRYFTYSRNNFIGFRVARS